MKPIQTLIFFSLIFICKEHSAQSISGSIYGKVTDEKNRPIEFAIVQAIEDGILKGGAKTDLGGNYEIKPLEPGTYTLSVSYLGMEKVEITDIPLLNDDRRKVDVNMEKDFGSPKPLRTIRTVTMPFFDRSDPFTQTMYRSDMKHMPIR